VTRTVVVTGAHGFVGRNVARRFARDGWEVTGIGHGYWSQDDLAANGISFWHASDVTLEALVTYGGEPDVIAHCAGSGSVSFSMAHPYEDYVRTVATTASVLEYIRLHSARTRLVYPSSAAVYGVAQKLPIAESDALNPASPYGLHKVMAEMLCRSYASHFGLVVSIARLFSVYGEELRKQLLWDACNKAIHGEAVFFGSGAELRDWVHVDDAADLMYTLAGRADRDCLTINGGTGHGASVADVLNVVFECLKIQTPPRFSGEVRAGDPPGYQADMTLAASGGWKPRISWRDGVARYAQWFIEQQQ
jgi:UDP-glucose 4-epimerase